MAGGQLYGAAVWDPLLIIAQILSLQCLFYLSLGLWEAIFIAPYTGTRLTVAHLLDWRSLNFNHYVGYMSMVVNFVNAPVTAVWLLWVVERSKKCLDFGCTCYFFHLIACWIYSKRIPASLWWWGCNLGALTVAVLLGELLCAKREMADIPIGSTGRAAPRSPSPTPDRSALTSALAAAGNAIAARTGVVARAGAAVAAGRPPLAPGVGGSGGGAAGGAGGVRQPLGITRLVNNALRGPSPRENAGGVQMSSLSGSPMAADHVALEVLERADSKSRLLGGTEKS